MSLLPDLEALARSHARIAQLEPEALERAGDVEEDRRGHLERYRLLVLAIAQVIWTRNREGAMEGEQLSWTTYTGQSLAEYWGRGWLAADHPDDRARTEAAWRHAVETGELYEIEHRLRRHDGVHRHFSVRAVPVLGEDGAIREWAGSHSDITERKRAEQTLRDGERQLRELADSMPQIVWAAGPNGDLDYYKCSFLLHARGGLR